MTYASCANPVSHGDLWLKRPLPKEYLLYAARDVYAISLLLKHFKEVNYINPYYDLSDKSQRYITMWRDGRPRSCDQFSSHALLPLGILDPPCGRKLKPCKSCNHHLSSECFSKAGWENARKRRCWVCRALAVKSNLETQWAQDEDEGGGCYDDEEEDEGGLCNDDEDKGGWCYDDDDDDDI